jgi:hypothetical protein
MERYLDAARKISRLAIGDPAMPVMVNIHRLDPEHPQDERVDDLPFGTRGGIAVRSEFPVDGTYIVRVDVGPRRATTWRFSSTASVSRVAPSLVAEEVLRWMLLPVNPIRRIPIPRPRRSIDRQCRAEARHRWMQQVQGRTRGGRGRGAAVGPLEFPLTLKAGPKLIGVAFVQRTEARDEATLRPRMRSRGTQPAINSVTISGPYNGTGGGDTPSRRRIFVCKPASQPKNFRVRADSVHACAPRVSPPANETDVRDLLPFYERGSQRGVASSSGSRERSNACSSARSFCSASNVSPRPLPPARRIASPTSNSPRACPSSSGAAFQTMNCWRLRRRDG